MNVANIKARTVTAVVAYDDPVSGETILLIINQAIYIPTLEHNLLCPMQMRLNDVLVSEIPSFCHRNHRFTLTLSEYAKSRHGTNT
jgi:hypothetical protein